MNNDYQGYAQACGRVANTGIVTGAIVGSVAGMVVPGANTGVAAGGLVGCVQGMIDHEPRDQYGRNGDRYALWLND